jgi:hypothetical protein
MAPGGPYRLEWAGLHGAASPQAFCASYRLDVCAPTDDKPFFFNMRRLADIGAKPPPGYLYSIDPFRVLVLTLGILAVLCAIGFVLPLAVARGVASRPRAGALSFFAFIGFGFLLLEVVLIQRFVLFLGFPTYALSVVLFALLVFTGVGALLSARGDPRRTLITALSAVTVLTVTAAFGRAVGVGGERADVGAGLGAGGGDRHHGGVHRRHPGRVCVLRGGARARRAGPLAYGCAGAPSGSS